MLQPEHYKIGQRVKCVHFGSHKRTGKTATIKNVAGRSITVEWDDGHQGDDGWGEHTSFDPIEDSPVAAATVAKAPSSISEPAPLDVCKKHYYGIQAPCTCKSRK